MGFQSILHILPINIFKLYTKMAADLVSILVYDHTVKKLYMKMQLITRVVLKVRTNQVISRVQLAFSGNPS